MTIAMMSDAAALIATSPVACVGGAIVGVTAVLYVVTRAPEFLVMTGTAGVYAVVATMPFVCG